MGEHQLALHIDNDTKQRLEAEARWRDQSEADVAADAIKAYLDHQTHLREAIEAAAGEADKGAFISRETMMGWVKDLFDGKKPPAPRPDIFLPPRMRP